MDHRIDVEQRAAYSVLVADVADDQLDVVVQISGALTARVDLAREVVQGADVVAALQEVPGNVRADESCASCEEDPLPAQRLPPRSAAACAAFPVTSFPGLRGEPSDAVPASSSFTKAAWKQGARAVRTLTWCRFFSPMFGYRPAPTRRTGGAGSPSCRRAGEPRGRVNASRDSPPASHH